jgi:uncharacterized protein with FMN-binding domain
MGEPEQVEGTKKKRKRRGLWIALICVLVVVIIIAAAGGIYAILFSSAASRLEVGKVDLSRVPDGTYEGSFRLYHDYASVRVVVKDHRIEEVRVLDMPSGIEEETSKLVGSVLNEQTLQVDTVSGPTTSLKVILRAIQEALSGTGQ